MATCLKSIKISDLPVAKEEKDKKFSSIIGMLALIILLSVILAIPFIQGETAEENNGIPGEYIRLSELNQTAIDKIEVELNNRLHAATNQPLFYKAGIHGDKVNLFVERDGWKALSLNEKADLLLRVAQIFRVTVTDFVGIPLELTNIKPEIHFYERDSNRKLAFWSEGGGIIIN